MHRIEIEVTVPSTDTLDIAGWVAFALSENPKDGMRVHRVIVEEEDA